MRKKMIDNPRYPHTITITRKKDLSDSVNPFTRAEEGEENIIIYCGPGRAYTDTTTDGDKNVDRNKRKASIPVRFDKWGTTGQADEYKPWPMDGDTIETRKGNVYEKGRVKDFEPDNDRSIVYWEFVRN